MKIQKGLSTTFYPCPVVLVTCFDEQDGENIVTLAWAGVLDSTPPMIGIGVRPSRYSAALIDRTREFVVNIPTADLLEKVDYCGIVSGYHVNKFEAVGFTKEPAAKIKAPMIKECPVNLECIVRRTILLGSHRLYIGEILETHIDEKILNSSGNIDYLMARPFVYNTSEYWSIDKQIGTHGFSKNIFQPMQK